MLVAAAGMKTNRAIHPLLVILAILICDFTPTAALAARTKFAPSVPGAQNYKCMGPKIKLFDNSNTGGVLNGGAAPNFGTKGQTYCLDSIVTYHWNNGLGATPGTVGL